MLIHISWKFGPPLTCMNCVEEEIRRLYKHASYRCACVQIVQIEDRNWYLARKKCIASFSNRLECDTLRIPVTGAMHSKTLIFIQVFAITAILTPSLVKSTSAELWYNVTVQILLFPNGKLTWTQEPSFNLGVSESTRQFLQRHLAAHAFYALTWLVNPGWLSKLNLHLWNLRTKG